MLRGKKIKDPNGTGEYTVYESPDVEFVDPIEHYSKSIIGVNVGITRDMLLGKKIPFPSDEIEKAIFKIAVKDWIDRYNEIMKTDVPANLLSVLTASSKNNQVKLLKGLSISPDQFIAFIFKARLEHGFLYSTYSAEHHHKGLDLKDLPKVIEVREDGVRKIGETTLTDGQLKQVVEHRKVIVSKFLDKGKEWHCLFLTYDSLRGKEAWKDGQPHYHYISDKFGIPRSKVVEELKNNKYHLGNLPHIDLIEYRDKKEKPV